MTLVRQDRKSKTMMIHPLQQPQKIKLTLTLVQPCREPCSWWQSIICHSTLQYPVLHCTLWVLNGALSYRICYPAVHCNTLYPVCPILYPDRKEYCSSRPTTRGSLTLCKVRQDDVESETNKNKNRYTNQQRHQFQANYRYRNWKRSIMEL